MIPAFSFTQMVEIMRFIQFLVDTAIQSLADAARVLGLLFWWLGIGSVRGLRGLSDHLRETKLRTDPDRQSRGRAEAVTCPVCGAANEAGQTHCFVCGQRL